MTVFGWVCLTFLAGFCQMLGGPILGPGAADAAVVRSIEFDRQPIFNQQDRDRFPWLPLAWVDRLHVDTRIRVLRRELLFTEGDQVTPEDIEESARKLRRTGFFLDAQITTSAASGDSVDVRVVTRELWTTAIDFSYEKFEDDRLWSVRFRERNFLGTARSFDFARSEDLDRSSWSLGLGDRQLFGGKWQGSVALANADDGESFGWALNRPFFEVADRYQLKNSYFHGASSPRYYLSRGRYIRPHLDLTRLEIMGQRRVWIEPRGVWRIGLGFSLEHQRFESMRVLEVRDASGSTGDTTSLSAPPDENHRWHTPMLSLSYQTRVYVQTKYLFAMGRTEDLPVGSDFKIRMGWTTRALHSTDSGLAFKVSEEYFARRGSGRFDRLRLSAEGLVLAGDASRTSLQAQLSTYHPLGESSMAAASILGAVGSGLERHRAFNLGLESGLRASRFRELTGDRLIRGNAELRWVYRPGLWSVLTPGLAAFGDIGTAWFESEQDLRRGDLRGALGVGLRLGFSRAANEMPIRVDLAWPLLYPSVQSSPVLSIGTGHIF